MAAKRKSNLTLEDKLQIIKKSEMGLTYTELAKLFKTNRSTVSRLVKNKDTVTEHINEMLNLGGNKMKKKYLRQPQNIILDKAILKWYKQKLFLGEPVYGPMIKKKALHFNAELGGSSHFQASDGWLVKFKHRHSIGNTATPPTTDQPTVLSFKTIFNKYLQDRGYSFENVYNADEIGLFYKCLPRTTSTDTRKEDRLTVLTCCNSTGDNKIPLFIVGKENNPEELEHFKYMSVIYESQKNAWINQNMFCNWFKNCFIPNVKKYQQRTKKKGKVILLLDETSYHSSIEVLNQIDWNFSAIYIPQAIASHIQPMEQGIVNKFKESYKKKLLNSFADSSACQVSEFEDMLELRDACVMADDSWNELMERDLKNAWAQLLPVYTDQSEETNESDEIFKICNRIPALSNLKKQSINDWLNSDCGPQGFGILTDEGILEEIRKENPDECLNDLYVDEIQESVNPPVDLMDSFKTVIKWAEKESDVEPSEIAVLKLLFNKATKNV